VLITWLKKLSSMHSRNLLDCLQLAMLLFQQMSGWLKSPSRTRAYERDSVDFIWIFIFSKQSFSMFTERYLIQLYKD